MHDEGYSNLLFLAGHYARSPAAALVIPTLGSDLHPGCCSLAIVAVQARSDFPRDEGLQDHMEDKSNLATLPARTSTRYRLSC